MSVIESLRQAHKERLKRMAARAVPQTDTGATTGAARAIVIDSKRRMRDRDYERAWAAEIMGLVECDEQSRGPPRILEIQRATAQHFRIALNVMLAEERARRVTQPRHVAMYLAKRLTAASFAAIGRAFAGRDHSTVVHAVTGIETRLLQHDRELAHHIARICDELGTPCL